MQEYVVSFEHLGVGDVERVGGKNASLGEMISNLKEDGIRDQFKIIVGGGPINDVFAESIGADGYSKTAFGAVEVCKKLIKSEPGAKLIVVE